MNKTEEYLTNIFSRDAGGTMEIRTNITFHKGNIPRESNALGAYFDGAKRIAINGRAKQSTIVHECAHAMETQGNKAVLKKCVEFFEARTKGEAIRQLPQYGRGCRGKIDKFPKFGYPGRTYAGAPREILSCGLQLMYEDPYLFAKTDFDYFRFILGVTRGWI